MKGSLRLKAGCHVEHPENLFEGFEVFDRCIRANISIENIESIFRHFILEHCEPLFFILELPSSRDEETASSSGIASSFHMDVYYIDGCSQETALSILTRAGNILFNDGLSSFGFGCHETGDEILFGKYNVLTLFSNRIESYIGFFEGHGIARVEKLITAWDTFSSEHPGDSYRYEENGMTVFDIPNSFKELGIYLAERRTLV